MLKEGMYVRCPFDREYPKYPRVFVCGRIESIDTFKNTVKAKVLDPFGTMDYFEDLKAGTFEFAIGSVTRCDLFTNSIVVFEGEHYKVLGHKLEDDEFYTYYLQNVENKEYVKANEKQVVAAFNNGHVNPVNQLRRYEFQNPVWHFGRNTVSKNINLLNNSVFGFKELAGSKIYLMPHQINTIMRCLQGNFCRYMLADEVGMGKTIEAISVLKIYLLNKSRQKVLIVVPDALEEQWKTELFFKFNITVGQNANGNFVGLRSYSSLNMDVLQVKWDFVVMDEVHRLLKDADIYNKAHSLSVSTDNLLLLSATPVQDRETEYLSLLRLLQPSVYDHLSLESFKILISKQNKIVQKTSFVLSDLESYQEAITEASNSNENPREFEDCVELFEEIQEYLEDICSSLNDEKLNVLFKKVSIDSEDMGVYDIKVLVSYICSNYQLENNIIRNRRKMLEGDNAEERILPIRKLHEVTYALDGDANTAETATYNALLKVIDTEIERNDDDIQNIVRPLLNSFFSSPFAFLNVAKSKLKGLEGSNDVLENAINWCAYEEYALENIEDILDDPDQYSQYYSTRVVSVFNYIYDNCSQTKTVLFTDYEETFDMYQKVIESIYDEDEIAFFGKSIKTQDAELNAYRFQNDDDCWLLLCDYTGGEGRNLQCADYIIHIDIPWDANMIEQRIGRLDRLERDKDRPIVNSVVVYASDSFESALFKFWKDGLQIFTQSLSGMEIIMHDINLEICAAIKNDLKYGLEERISEIINKAEKMRKEIRKEQSYDAASFIFKPMYSELNKLVTFYNKNENALFADTMASWAGLAGFKGQTSKSGVVTYSASSFSPKSAINSQLIPPRWKDYMNEGHNLFLDKIQSKYDEQKEKSHLERAIRGTFIRSTAIENDYIHFFAPGDAVFDCVIDNAVNNCKGQACAFEMKSSWNWSGFIFTWSLKPDETYLFERDISILALAPYRTYVATDQIVTVVAINNPDDLSDEEVHREYRKIASQPLKQIKKFTKHLGQRSGSKGIISFIEEYPYEVWSGLVKESYVTGQEKAMTELRKKMNIKGAREEMERSLSAISANANYYGLDQGDIDDIKNRLGYILMALKQSKVYLESASFMRMVKSDD